MPDVGATGARAEAGFRLLFDASFGPMVGLARLLGADDPEDVAAEAFMRLFESWSQLRSQAAAFAYVRTVVVRLVSNRRRHLSVAGRQLGRPQVIDHESAEDAVLRASDDRLAAALEALSVSRRVAVGGVPGGGVVSGVGVWCL